jgi:dTMP kinase
VFIVIEGIDGSGKSTQAKLLAERMGARLMRFPNRETPIGQLISGHLKGEWCLVKRTAEGGSLRYGALDDALMFQALQIANRVEAIDDIRRFGYAQGKILICDRYWPSGYAYGGADGLDKGWLMYVHQALPQPDLSILIDLDAQTAMERADARGSRERYERAGYLAEVRANYLELWERMKTNKVARGSWVVVPGEGVLEAVFQKLCSVAGV